MSNEQTDTTDTKGKKVDKTMETDTEDTKTPSQKLKEENDALEVELIRAQKIRDEALLAGTSGGRVEAEPPKELTDKEYSDKLDRGEVNPLKDDGIY